MPVRGILIDISDTLLLPFSNRIVPDTPEMIARLQQNGVVVFLLSNNNYPSAALAPFNVPATNILTQAMVGGKKGTGSFVNYVVDTFGIQRNELLYFGDTEQDMYEAVNGHLIFIKAGWSRNRYRTRYGIHIGTPSELNELIENYFLKEHLWYFTIDASDEMGLPINYRALLDPDSARERGIHRLLKEKIRNDDLATHLTYHLIASVSLERLHIPDANGKPPIVCLYPGHNGQQTGALETFAAVAARLFKTDFLPDLIIRHRTALKSAYARRRAEVMELENQLGTIRINEEYRNKITNRRILVFDDFTTDGLGFETARHFLINGGAREVYCISVGKYGNYTQTFTANFGLTFDSFEPTTLKDDDFTKKPLRGTFNIRAAEQF